MIFEITPVAVSGTLQGTAFLSAIIQVETNSAPSFSALTFNTETAVVGDTVTIKHIYQDADNDAQGSHVFSWYRDGVEIAGASGESYTINADDKGTNITAKATAVALTGTLNGTAQSVTGSLAIAATNQAPTVSNVVIVDKNGGLVVPGDELEVTWDYQDADGDEQGDTTIGWQYFRPNSSGGIPGSNGSKTYIVSGTYFGQKIQVVITPVAKTGETYGNATRSQKVSVMSLPTSKDHQIVDLNDGEIEVGDILEAQYTFVDADGDLEDVSGARFSWYRNNSDLVASGSSKTYTVVAADAGQTLKFNNSVRSDAGEQGYVYGSAPVQVADEVAV